MFIWLRMDDSMYFNSSLCIQISIKQGYKDSLFTQINFFGPTIKQLTYMRESEF